MGNATVVRKEEQSPKTDWFQNKRNGAIYRRGPGSLCINAETGGVATLENAYKGKAIEKVFDDPEQYTPLYPGDQIVITL